MKYYYLIKVAYNEWGADYRFIADTFEEARANVKNFTDWYSPKGSCRIVKVDQEFNPIKTWSYWEDKLRPGFGDETEDHD